jgi:hypothetical protein
MGQPSPRRASHTSVPGRASAGAQAFVATSPSVGPVGRRTKRCSLRNKPAHSSRRRVIDDGIGAGRLAKALASGGHIAAILVISFTASALLTFELFCRDRQYGFGAVGALPMTSPTRRAVVCSLSVFPAIAATTISVSDDPVIAAIERYRCACSMLETIDECAEPSRYASAENEIFNSGDAVFASPPRTIEGAKALIEFVLEDAAGAGDADHWRCLALASLSQAMSV